LTNFNDSTLILFIDQELKLLELRISVQT